MVIVMLETHLKQSRIQLLLDDYCVFNKGLYSVLSFSVCLCIVFTISRLLYSEVNNFSWAIFQSFCVARGVESVDYPHFSWPPPMKFNPFPITFSRAFAWLEVLIPPTYSFPLLLFLFLFLF